MCGLWGGHSDRFNTIESQRVYALGYMSVFRGSDSTGIIAGARHKNKLKIRERKDCVPSFQFLADGQIRSMIFNKDAQVIVGHCRAATHGTVNHTNAHPFHCGHIIGVHNGTIDSFAPAKGDEDNSSDSRVLFEKIASEGLEDALGQAKSGAFAIAYIDTNKLTLNFVRNMKRPLWIMYSKTPGVFYWASEERFLEFIAKGENSDQLLKPFQIKPDYHYSIQIGSRSNLRDEEVKSLKTIIHRTYPCPSKVSSFRGAHDPYLKEDWGDWSEWEADLGKVTKPGSTEPTLERLLSGENELLQPGSSEGANREAEKEPETEEKTTYRAGHHGYIDPYTAQLALGQGCCMCGEVSVMSDEVYWLRCKQKTYVCDECVDEPLVNNMCEIDKDTDKGVLGSKIVRHYH